MRYTYWTAEEGRVVGHSLGRAGRVQDPQQFFEVVLHQAVEQDLVLVSQ